MDYLCEHLKGLCEVSEVQKIGQVLDRYFKISRKNKETFPSCERNNELVRVLHHYREKMPDNKPLKLFSFEEEKVNLHEQTNWNDTFK